MLVCLDEFIVDKKINQRLHELPATVSKELAAACFAGLLQDEILQGLG